MFKEFREFKEFMELEVLGGLGRRREERAGIVGVLEGLRVQKFRGPGVRRKKHTHTHKKNGHTKISGAQQKRSTKHRCQKTTFFSGRMRWVFRITSRLSPRLS